MANEIGFLRYDVHGMWLSGRLRCGQLEVVTRCDETHFTGYLKHFCYALRGSKNSLDSRPHIFLGKASFPFPRRMRFFQPNVRFTIPVNRISSQGELHGKIDHRSTEAQKRFTVSKWKVEFFEPYCCKNTRYGAYEAAMFFSEAGLLIVWQKRWLK